MEEKKFKTKYSVRDCIWKQFEYVSAISTKAFKIGHGKYEKYFMPPSRTIISQNLFRQYSCLDYNCTRCCSYVGFVNILNEDEVANLYTFSDKEALLYVEEDIIINEKPSKIFIYDHNNSVCGHVNSEENYCNIYGYEPIHCVFPLMKLKRVRDTVYITREPYGRNWLMKCPVVFKPMTEMGFQYTTSSIRRLMDFAREYGIPTKGEKILTLIYDRYQEMKQMLNESDFEEVEGGAHFKLDTKEFGGIDVD